MTTLTTVCLALGYTWLVGCVLLATGCVTLGVVALTIRLRVASK